MIKLSPNMKKLITLMSIVAACSANPVVRHAVIPVVPSNTAQAVVPRSEELHWWGYRIVDGNLSYEHNTRTYDCTLRLGNDAVIKDLYCDNRIDQIYDQEGYLSCFYYPSSSRCNLANDIFARKKALLRVEETHQRWLETGGDDVLRDYL